LFFGNPSLVGIQAITVVATYLFSGILTFVILKAISVVLPLRATQEEEELGLDATLHGEDAYRDMVVTGALARLQEERAGLQPTGLAGNLSK